MKYQAVYMYTLEINYRLTMFRKKKKGIIRVHVIAFQSERNIMCENVKKRRREKKRKRILEVVEVFLCILTID